MTKKDLVQETRNWLIYMYIGLEGGYEDDDGEYCEEYYNFSDSEGYQVSEHDLNRYIELSEED